MSPLATSIPSPNDSSAELSPEHFHTMLAGCKWAAAAAGAVSVKDERGQLLGIGATKRAAADVALRVRQNASVQPQGYYECLAGCHFLNHPRPGDKHLWAAVADSFGKVIAFAATKADAALAAARHVLRQRDAHSLSLDDFRRICTVITVDVARGKTGKAKNGAPYLRMDTRDDPEDMARYRALVTRLLIDTHSGAPGFQTYEARTRWATEVGEDLLMANFFDGSTNAVRLDNGEWLLLRKPDGPPARRCIEEVHEAVVQGSTEASTEAATDQSSGADDAERVHDRMR